MRHAPSGRAAKGASALSLLLVTSEQGDFSLVTAPDDFTVTPAAAFPGPASSDRRSTAMVGVARHDHACKTTLGEAGLGRSGLVKLRELQARVDGQALGTFDVTLGPQLDKLTGSFAIPYCDVQWPTSLSCE